jgi:hypothetical protein
LARDFHARINDISYRDHNEEQTYRELTILHYPWIYLQPSIIYTKGRRKNVSKEKHFWKDTFHGKDQ